MLRLLARPFACFIGVMVLLACSKQPEHHVAWRCMAEKDVMQLRVGSKSEGAAYEAISFDGGGLAILLRGRRPFAPDFNDVVIATTDDATLDIFLRSSNKHLVVENVDPNCLEWLKTNKRLNKL